MEKTFLLVWILASGEELIKYILSDLFKIKTFGGIMIIGTSFSWFEVIYRNIDKFTIFIMLAIIHSVFLAITLYANKYIKHGIIFGTLAHFIFNFFNFYPAQLWIITLLYLIFSILTACYIFNIKKII